MTLLALLTGYDLWSVLNGSAVSTQSILFWSIAAVLIGPVLGLGAFWLMRGPVLLGAVGVSCMSGVLVGEGVHGLLYVADTTYPPYWWGSVLTGAGLLLWSLVRKLHGASAVSLAILSTGVVSAAFVVVYANTPEIIFLISP